MSSRVDSYSLSVMREPNELSWSERSRGADNTASLASTSVACLERLLVAAFAKVVGAGVADHGAANDGVGSVEHKPVVAQVQSALSVGTSLDVSEVTVVAGLLSGATVGDTLGVPVGAGRHAALRKVA